jgi:uncharacterized BrkB/YihY/UPF0761 family membrane protein
MDIPGLRGLGLGTMLQRAITDFSADDMATYAAALAYQVLCSLFPFLLFFLARISVGSTRQKRQDLAVLPIALPTASEHQGAESS